MPCLLITGACRSVDRLCCTVIMSTDAEERRRSRNSRHSPGGMLTSADLTPFRGVLSCQAASGAHPNSLSPIASMSSAYSCSHLQWNHIAHSRQHITSVMYTLGKAPHGKRVEVTDHLAPPLHSIWFGM